LTKVNNAAALACLGSAEARARVLRALTGANDADVELASVYLSHRPMTDVEELRVVATGIARMPGSGAQVRALDTLARHRLSDGQSLNELARLFPAAASVDVQRAIASVLIRADYQAIAKPEFVRALSQNRRKSPDGTDIIDILIRRLRASDSLPKEQE
jgi:RES domain-containing protein